MKQLIVYDLDGTLVDTREDIAASANHLRARVNLAPLPSRQICGYVGLGLKKLIQGVLETEDERKVEEGTRIYRTHYAQHMLDNTALYPHARDVLEHFRSRKQAVITNKPNPYSRQILEALGVAPFFIEIVAGDSGLPKKPDPASLRLLLEREHVLPTDALFVGDSAVDIETGAKVGVTTVAVAHGFSEREELEEAQPDALVADFKELLDLARREAW